MPFYFLTFSFSRPADFWLCSSGSIRCVVWRMRSCRLFIGRLGFLPLFGWHLLLRGQNAHNQIAIYPHQARTAEDVPLEPGDVIGVAGNHWDGYSKGVSRKLGRTGLYPSYKVKEKIETVKYPTYPEADKLLSL